MLPGNQGYRKENCSLDRKSRVVMGMPGKQWRKENDPFLFYSVNSSTNIFRAHIYLQNLFCFPYFHGFCILTSSIQPLPSFLQSPFYFLPHTLLFSHERFQPFFTKHTLPKYKLHTSSASHHFLWILIHLHLQEIWSISSLLWSTVLIPVHCR